MPQIIPSHRPFQKFCFRNFFPNPLRPLINQPQRQGRFFSIRPGPRACNSQPHLMASGWMLWPGLGSGYDPVAERMPSGIEALCKMPSNILASDLARMITMAERLSVDPHLAIQPCIWYLILRFLRIAVPMPEKRPVITGLSANRPFYYLVDIRKAPIRYQRGA